MQYFLDNDAYYQPFPFVLFELDTSKYYYIQVVNYCACQYEDSSVFTFENIADLIYWLNLPLNTGAVVVGHCSGILTFSFYTSTFFQINFFK